MPRLLSNTVTLSVFAGLVKIAGAVKSVAIARAFGSGPELDAYLLAFLAPSMIADTFCGALAPVTVPRLIELQHRYGQAEAVAAYSKLLARSVGVALAGSAAIAFALAAFLKHETAVLALIMLPVIPLNAVANVWRAVLNAQNKFMAPAAALLATPAVITAAALAAPRVGIRALAVATAFGAAAELVFLAGKVRACGFPIVPRLTRTREPRRFRMRAFREQYGYLVASGMVSSVTLAAGQMMASWLGSGGVSALNYGTRLAGVLISIGPSALGVAMLPGLSQAAVAGSEQFQRSVTRLLGTSMAVAVAATAVFMALSGGIVRITLQHGAFTAADSATVAAVQRSSLLQVPFVAGIAILMRAFTVCEKNRLLLPISAALLPVNLGLSYGLMRIYGVAGIALGASLAQAVMLIAMAAVFLRPGWLAKEKA